MRTKSDKLRRKPSRCVWGMTVELNTSSNSVLSGFLKMPGMFQLREFHGYKDLVYDLLVCDIVRSCNLLRIFQGRCCLHLTLWRQRHYILPGKRQQTICLLGISIFRLDDWHHAPNSVIRLLTAVSVSKLKYELIKSLSCSYSCTNITISNKHPRMHSYIMKSSLYAHYVTPVCSNLTPACFKSKVETCWSYA
jgi:hypothetical protein